MKNKRPGRLLTHSSQTQAAGLLPKEVESCSFFKTLGRSTWLSEFRQLRLILSPCFGERRAKAKQSPGPAGLISHAVMSSRRQDKRYPAGGEQRHIDRGEHLSPGAVLRSAWLSNKEPGEASLGWDPSLEGAAAKQRGNYR